MAMPHGHYSGYEWSFYSSVEDVGGWTSCDSNFILALDVFLLRVLSLGFSLQSSDIIDTDVAL